MAKKKSKTVKKAAKSSASKKKKPATSAGSKKAGGKGVVKASDTKQTGAGAAIKKKTTKSKVDKPAPSAPAKAEKPVAAKITKKKVRATKARAASSSTRPAASADRFNGSPFLRKAASPSTPAAPSWSHPINGNGHTHGGNGNGEPTDWTDAQLRKVKTGLTKKDYDYFMSLLLEKRAELIGDVAGMEAARRVEDGDISHVPLHMADAGSDNYDQEFTLGLMESDRKLLSEIDNAIERIQKRTYGVCLVSGQPIPRARLEIKPWAKYTIEVVRERERLGL